MLRRHHLLRRRLAIPLVRVLIALQFWLTLPAPDGTRMLMAASQSKAQDAKATTPDAPKVVANRTVPKVTPPASTLTFSDEPTVQEIFNSHVFPEPLVPLGRTPTAQENAALARALLVFYSRRDLQWIAPLQIFLEQHPQSPWNASLLVSIAGVLRDAGAFSRAMETADRAWELAKDATDQHGRAIADLAFAESISIAAMFGQADLVKARVESAGGRDIRGPAGVRVNAARETIGMIVSHPENIIASGPEAVRVLWKLRGRKLEARAGSSRNDLDVASEGGWSEPSLPAALRTFVPTAAGTSLAQVGELARQSGLRMQMAKRVDARVLPLPAIMHWRLGHFSAVVAQDDDRYQVIDVALGGSRWVPRDLLLAENSGYWLIPAGVDREGWSDVSDADATAVVGHSCPPGGPPPNPPDCPNCNAGKGMPIYYLDEVTASLVLLDQPTTYTAPRGPDVTFRLSYNHRDRTQPQIFNYANLGPMWGFPWARFLQEEPMVCGQTCDPAHVWVQMGSGAAEFYSSPNGQGEYPAHWNSKAVLVRTSTNPLRYERRLAEGGVEVYGAPDGAPAGQKRVFLTQVIDPQGLSITLTWDAQFRPVAITDASGQVSTLSYEHPTDPLKLTRFTDPYGRSAVLTYTAAGQLASITDALGLTTAFSYAAEDFISAMRTPYGVTAFRHESWDLEGSYVQRFIEATDPVGGTEHVEFRYEEPSLATSLPVAEVPTGFTAWNDRLEWYNTFTWDKRQWMLGANDITKATITRWTTKPMWPNGTSYSAPVPHSVKNPLESRVWYKYPDQTSADYLGTFKQPTVVARVLDDGTSQIREYAYNAQGQMTLARDPLGRETTHEYAPNGIDRIATHQKNGASYDLLETRTYNSQHLPLTVTDAAGQTTTITYNAAGQLLTVTNAKSETTTSTYDPDGRLLTITGPVSGSSTTYTYDGLGRVHTLTDPEAYTVTTDYDVFDRPTVTTYPDGTSEAVFYDRLDVATKRDRLARVTRTFHDAQRHVTATRDALGRTMRQEWCTCGSLDALVDSNGNRTHWERNIQGGVTKEIRADARETVYTYESTTSRLHTMTDPKQQVTTYSYFADDSLQSLAYTNAQIPTPSVTFTYDATYGRVATMIDSIGVTTYAYRPVGVVGATQLGSVDGPLTDDAITYGYDELGRVTSRAINGSANTITRVFDALGRMTSETNVLGTSTYTYDGVTNRVATMTYPNGQTSLYSYLGNTQDHRLQTIHHKYPNGATLSKFDYTYNAVGNILTWQQQVDSNPQALWTYGHDAADQLTSAVKTTTDATPITLSRYAYTYDPAGNRTSEQVDDMLTGASYNTANELISQQPIGAMIVTGIVSEPATVTIQGQLAPVTPANQFHGTVPVLAGTNTFSVVATDSSGNSTTKQYQVFNSGPGRTFTYDANGNLIGDGTRTFEWDARNQLVAVVMGVHRSEFTYDGLQRRVRVIEKENAVTQSDTAVLWCGSSICEERSSTGVTVRQALAYGERINGVAHFVTTDHLGSATDVLDSSGVRIAGYSYDPWGRRTLTTGTDASSKGFTGHEWPKNGGLSLTHFRAYDPELGRWLSEDPAGGVDGSNLYAYVGNDPVAKRDPSGLMKVKDDIHVEVVDQNKIPTNVRDKNPPVARTQLRRGITCECTELTCGRYQLETTLKIEGLISVPTIVRRSPLNDRSVKDPLTAWLHEYRRHIDPAIEAARRAVHPYEHSSYPSYGACISECVAKAIPDGLKAFDRTISETQRAEDEGR
jgi:RHS repeat-associated protein